jgi:hypothetical protein
MTATGFDPAVARAVGLAMNPLWSSILTAPEVNEEYERIGLPARCRYFAPRAAPLGLVPASVVVATFFNFSPAAVEKAIPLAWTVATPAEVVAAQLRGMDRAFSRAFAEIDPVRLEEVARLLKTAALAACERPEGRPLFAAYASLPWADEAHLVMFQAYYLLREFRGDGHIATMLADGFRGLDAVALHIVMVPALWDVFRASRGWTDEQWAQSHEGLVRDGWLERDSDGNLVLTEDGRSRREALEIRTDGLAAAPYAAIGDEGCQELLAFGPTLKAAVETAGLTLRLTASRR